MIGNMIIVRVCLFLDDAAMERLMSQGTFAIDADIRSLEGQELEAFLDFGLKVIHSKRNFDLINGYIGLFVKVCVMLFRFTSFVQLICQK